MGTAVAFPFSVDGTVGLSRDGARGLGVRALGAVGVAACVLAGCVGSEGGLVPVAQPTAVTAGAAPAPAEPLGTVGDGPVFEEARSAPGAPVVYSTTGGPLPHDERVRRVHVGANVRPLPDWKRPGRWDVLQNGAQISTGVTHEGASGVRVEQYLRAHLDDKWEPQGYANEPSEDTPGLASFADPPVLRLARGTSAEHAAWALHAAAIVNTALPWDRRIVLGSDAPPLSAVETIPDGQIFVDFAAKSDWVPRSEGAAVSVPSHLMEYDHSSERWEIRGMRAAHVWVDPSAFGTQAEMIRVLVHEYLHALGLRGHPYIEEFPESVLRNMWPELLATDNHVPDIDADGLLAIYTRLAPGTEPEELSVSSLGPWENRSLRIHGELDIPGGAAFGVEFRNGLTRPWAEGPEPLSALAENRELVGLARWDGAMAGFTPEGRSVHGSAEISVDLGPLTGRADFRDLSEWSAAKWVGDGRWSVWGDGDLGYSIAVQGNAFRETEGDEGVLTGAFVGRRHEGAVGTLERRDLSAAFGADIASGLKVPSDCGFANLRRDCVPAAGRRVADLTAYVAPAVDRGEVPGMIAAIVDEDGIIAIGAAGVRKQGSAAAFTVNDLVHLGSNTKAMTSTMLATLVEDGTFARGWDTTIADVFPELLDEIHEDYHPVALSQLVRMRGGIARDARDWGLYSSNRDVAKRRYEILRANLAGAPAGTAGDYLYSNLSYMVAGAMAERLTGMSWETLMERRLFAPLGIASAGFGAPGTSGTTDQPWGHRSDWSGGWVADQHDNPAALGPAGTVHMSVEDWAKFISLWLTDGEPAILDRETLRELGTPITETYAAGWTVVPRSWAEGTALTHDGTNGAWWSVLWIAPNRGLAYLVVANVSDVFQSGAVYGTLDSLIFSLITDTDRLMADLEGSGGSRAGTDRSGTGEEGQRLDPEAVRSLTGAAAPAFSDADVGASVSGLAGTVDTLLASDLLLFTGEGAPVRGRTACGGAECLSGVGEAMLKLTAGEVRFGSPALAHEAVANHRGVSLAQGRGESGLAGTPADYDAYGGWLEHSFFAVETGTIAGGLLKGTPFAYGYSAGRSPGSNPRAADGGGTWRGVVVGADVSGAGTRGHAIQGDAAISIADFDDPRARIAFTRIFDLQTEAARADMIWSGVAVSEGGFSTGSDGDTIEGRFYGPNHEEAGGVFERDGVLGAFGVARSAGFR